MSVSSVSNSTDGASATALLSPMQLGQTGYFVQAPVLVRLRDNSNANRSSASHSTLSLKAFAALDTFDPEEARWSPAQAFNLRRSGQIGVAADWPTLFNYLSAAGFMQDAPNSPLIAKAHKLPKPDETLTVYARPCVKKKPAPYEVVMPGSYVAISKSLARLMAKLPPNVPAHLRSTKVYPDELVYLGDAYGFVYVPRSLELGFERYQADLGRVLDDASTASSKRTQL